MTAMIPTTVLLIAEPLPGLETAEVVDALERGLQAGNYGVAVVEADTDELRAARAVVILAARLDRSTLAGSMAFQVATRARQAGVPAYAVTAENALDSFDARMLDLQVILEAGTTRALSTAGRKLANVL